MWILGIDSRDQRFFQGLLLCVIFASCGVLVFDGTVCIAGRKTYKRNQRNILAWTLLLFKHGASVDLSGDIQQGFEQQETDGPLYVEGGKAIMLRESCRNADATSLVVHIVRSRAHIVPTCTGCGQRLWPLSVSLPWAYCGVGVRPRRARKAASRRRHTVRTLWGELMRSRWWKGYREFMNTGSLTKNGQELL